ncbi:hypothetical protein ACYJ1Y_10810 [Natrialbaceae archaeon A-gly3]
MSDTRTAVLVRYSLEMPDEPCFAITDTWIEAEPGTTGDDVSRDREDASSSRRLVSLTPSVGGHLPTGLDTFREDLGTPLTDLGGLIRSVVILYR